jgi:hypothetical protein
MCEGIAGGEACKNGQFARKEMGCNESNLGWARACGLNGRDMTEDTSTASMGSCNWVEYLGEIVDQQATALRRIIGVLESQDT